MTGPEPTPWLSVVAPPSLSVVALPWLDVVVFPWCGVVALLFLRVPPTAPPITAASTTTIATMIIIIPFVVRQNGTGFVEDKCPFSSFAGGSEPCSVSA